MPGNGPMTSVFSPVLALQAYSSLPLLHQSLLQWSCRRTFPHKGSILLRLLAQLQARYFVCHGHQRTWWTEGPKDRPSIKFAAGKEKQDNLFLLKLSARYDCWKDGWMLTAVPSIMGGSLRHLYWKLKTHDSSPALLSQFPFPLHSCNWSFLSSISSNKVETGGLC